MVYTILGISVKYKTTGNVQYACDRDRDRGSSSDSGRDRGSDRYSGRERGSGSDSGRDSSSPTGVVAVVPSHHTTHL